MKQHITITDIMNCTKEQQEKLRLLAKKMDFDNVNEIRLKTGRKLIQTDNVKSTIFSNYYTIGKMIEILMNNEGFDIELQRMSDGTNIWVISYYKGYDEEIPIGGCSTFEELCDALFKAVKEVL